MAQTRRRTRQRGPALLRLPTDVLYKIATHAVLPELVVAAGTNVEARTALRKGTDEAERSRFGGIGMTVREAEHVLRTRYRDMLDDSELESREAAGRAFDHGRIMIEYEWDWEDAPIADINSDLIRTLVAYGADPNVQDLEFGATVLHVVAECAPPDAVDLARLLLAAGADIDVECHPDNSAGRTPLAWCLACEPVTETSYELAQFLIEQGCDVLKADVGFQAQAEEKGGDPTLLEALENLDRTPANELISDLISAELVAAGPERRETALNAARRSRDAWPPPANAV